MIESVRINGPTPEDDVELEVLRTFGARLKGLLCTSPQAGPVLLLRCGSVHTFGMRYPIDVALVDEYAVVARSQRALAPGRILSHPAAVMTIERPASAGWWPAEGDLLEMHPIREGADAAEAFTTR